MNYLEAIIMGLIQGVTEFLPVSSSGHLAIFRNIFNISDPDAVFDILLHAGTIVAVLVVYFSDIKKLIVEGFKLLFDLLVNAGLLCKHVFGRQQVKYRRLVNSAYRKFVVLLFVSTIPTGILGILLKDTVKIVRTDLLIIGVCLLITACLLVICDMSPEGKKKPKNVTYVDAFSVGVAQGAATLPGISRSGTTIAVCTKLGFDRKFAVKYSFIMSVPAILGAVILEIDDVSKTVKSGVSVGPYIVGMIVAAIVGYFCIKTLLRMVCKKKMKYFAAYCVAAGLVSIIMHIAG